MYDVQVIDTQTAYATASRTVAFYPPVWARSAVFYWDISAVAGTTPIADCKFQIVSPTTSQARDLRLAAFGQQTAATRGMYLMYGPDMTDAAGDGTNVSVKGVIPITMQAVLAFDRTTGNETYTYTLAATYRS